MIINYTLYSYSLKKNISDGVYHYGGKTVTLNQHEEKKPRGGGGAGMKISLEEVYKDHNPGSELFN